MILAGTCGWDRSSPRPVLDTCPPGERSCRRRPELGPTLPLPCASGTPRSRAHHSRWSLLIAVEGAALYSVPSARSGRPPTAGKRKATARSRAEVDTVTG